MDNEFKDPDEYTKSRQSDTAVPAACPCGHIQRGGLMMGTPGPESNMPSGMPVGSFMRCRECTNDSSLGWFYIVCPGGQLRSPTTAQLLYLFISVQNMLDDVSTRIEKGDKEVGPEHMEGLGDAMFAVFAQSNIALIHEGYLTPVSREGGKILSKWNGFPPARTTHVMPRN